jgi:hypothetical protein
MSRFTAESFRISIQHKKDREYPRDISISVHDRRGLTKSLGIESLHGFNVVPDTAWVNGDLYYPESTEDYQLPYALPLAGMDFDCIFKKRGRAIIARPPHYIKKEKYKTKGRTLTRQDNAIWRFKG